MAKAIRGIPELDLARVRRFCEGRVPARAAHQVRLELEVDGVTLTIVERRAPWTSELGPEWSRVPIARLRYSPLRTEWTLFWCDRNLAFHRLREVEPTATVEVLLRTVDADRPGVFWG
jgi:hypothetical protein